MPPKRSSRQSRQEQAQAQAGVLQTELEQGHLTDGVKKLLTQKQHGPGEIEPFVTFWTSWKTQHPDPDPPARDSAEEGLRWLLDTAVWLLQRSAGRECYWRDGYKKRDERDFAFLDSCVADFSAVERWTRGVEQVGQYRREVEQWKEETGREQQLWVEKVSEAHKQLHSGSFVGACLKRADVANQAILRKILEGNQTKLEALQHSMKLQCSRCLAWYRRRASNDHGDASAAGLGIPIGERQRIQDEELQTRWRKSLTDCKQLFVKMTEPFDRLYQHFKNLDTAPPRLRPPPEPPPSGLLEQDVVGDDTAVSGCGEAVGHVHERLMQVLRHWETLLSRLLREREQREERGKKSNKNSAGKGAPLIIQEGSWEDVKTKLLGLAGSAALAKEDKGRLCMALAQACHESSRQVRADAAFLVSSASGPPSKPFISLAHVVFCARSRARGWWSTTCTCRAREGKTEGVAGGHLQEGCSEAHPRNPSRRRRQVRSQRRGARAGSGAGPAVVLSPFHPHSVWLSRCSGMCTAQGRDKALWAGKLGLQGSWPAQQTARDPANGTVQRRGWLAS